MIFSNLDIQAACKSGDIVINPFDEASIKPGSYTFHLGKVLFIPKETLEIDAIQENQEYDQIDIPSEGYVVAPGQFLLGKLQEKLTLSMAIGCFLDVRGSLARLGFTPLINSIFVEPGVQDTFLTLEMYNFSKNPIRIYAGMKMVKGIFVLTKTAASENYGSKVNYQPKDPNSF